MSFVRIANLTKRFGTHTAVGNVSFDVPQGSTLALLGPSGCGKTTILRCLAGLETPDGGRIEIGGKTVFDRASATDGGTPSSTADAWHARARHSTARRRICAPAEGSVPATCDEFCARCR